MARVAVVVLNYLNYTDTIECVDSILDMRYSICGIVIVDNGSYNDSVVRLEEKYRGKKSIHLVVSKKNTGYARGNNLGIDYARKKLKADFVLVVNNDTVFIDRNYVEGLLDRYERGVGVIGSGILLKDRKEQPPIVYCLGLKDMILRYINILSSRRGSNFEFPVYQGEKTVILHGCALLFTPDFFVRYRGFYKRTFLYEEEAILYLMCTYRGLKQVYAPEVKIYHKEDQSSLMSFQNDKLIMEKYAFESLKYVIWWGIKNQIKTLGTKFADRGSLIERR